MPITRKGHGNGIRNSRIYNFKTDVDFCGTDGHDWCTYKYDKTQEFCSVCGKFRQKEVKNNE